MASDVAIVNAGLRAIGAARITALGEESEEGRISGEEYANIRDELIRSHPWNFAMERQSLPANVATPDWEYSYSYTLPSDPAYCLRVWEADGEDETTGKWKVEGRNIVTNLGAPLPIRFVKRVTDPEQFDALFRKALSLRLAFDWAETLTGRSAIHDRMEVKFKAALAEARSADGQEGIPDAFEASEWLDARY